MGHALAECVTSRRARCLRAPSPAACVTRRLCAPLTLLCLCPAPPAYLSPLLPPPLLRPLPLLVF